MPRPGPCPCRPPGCPDPETRRRPPFQMSSKIGSKDTAMPAMSRRQARRIRGVSPARQQARLAGCDLQPEIFGVNPALRETAGDKPQAGLAGAHEHVAQLLL